MNVLPIGHAGRLGNHVFRNLAAHFLAQTRNLRVTYSIDFEKEFGCPLFQGTASPSRVERLREDDFESYIGNDRGESFDINNIYCQTQPFARRIKRFVLDNETAIRAHNPNSYDNDFVFVHVRLDDAAPWNPGTDYYLRALAMCKYTKGYVSTDSPNHSLVRGLIDRGLSLVSLNEFDTIRFGSSCKYIVLSHGTFSWTIGALSFGSKVVYPARFPVKWHGDIFLPEWESA